MGMENDYIKMYILFQSWRLLATQDSEESKKSHYNGGILEKKNEYLICLQLFERSRRTSAFSRRVCNGFDCQAV